MEVSKLTQEGIFTMQQSAKSLRMIFMRWFCRAVKPKRNFIVNTHLWGLYKNALFVETQGRQGNTKSKQTKGSHCPQPIEQLRIYLSFIHLFIFSKISKYKPLVFSGVLIRQNKQSNDTKKKSDHLKTRQKHKKKMNE